MDDSTDVTTFDDGLYHHPPTKSSTKHPSPSTTVADPDAAMIVSASSADPVMIDTPAPTPTSLGTDPGRKSKHSATADIPQQTFAAASSSSVIVSTSAAISSSSPLSTPSAEILSIGSIAVESPPPQHNSARAVVIALVSVSAVLGVVFLVGYLTSQRFREWRESRKSRYTETKWKISRPIRDGHSPCLSMREVPHIEISTNELVYGPADPFARSMPRQCRMPFNLGGSAPVEEIDEERGWLWGTQTSNKTRTGGFVTPGLGIGRYRSKKGRGQLHDSLGSRPCHAEPEDVDDIKEELLYDDGDEAGSVSEYDNDKQETTSQGFPLAGVSYLYGRLKESISSRSAFNSLGSSTRRLGVESSRGQWNEVGQLAYDDQKDITAQDDDDDFEKTVDFQASVESTASLRSATAPAEFVLPELPAFTWDDHSGLKIAKTKRTRAPSLEVEINGAQAEYIPASQAFRDQTGSCPRTSAVNSVRQLVTRLEENGGKNMQLSASPSSQQPRRKRKEALPSKYGTHSDLYSNSPTRHSSRSRIVGKTHGLVKAKSKHLYPGGYVGRSPTKKLRRKDLTNS